MTNVHRGSARPQSGRAPPPRHLRAMSPAMSPATIIGLILLVFWGAVTLGTEAPGAVHLLLTAGVYLVIHGIVTRDTPRGPTSGA